MQTDLGNKGREAPQSELQQVKCILHIGKETGSEKVKLFTVQMLENCREKSLVYKFREKSEYATIIIPASADKFLSNNYMLISLLIGFWTICLKWRTRTRVSHKIFQMECSL